MTTLLASPQRRLDVGFFFGVAAAAGLASVLTTRSPNLGLALMVVAAAAAVAARRPVLLAVLTPPALFGFQSLGIGGGLSISDAVLIVAACLAVPALSRSPALAASSALSRAFLLYLGLLLPTLIANWTPAAGAEWVHRLVIVAGAAVVGVWLVQEHVVTAALRLLVTAAAVLAIAAVVTSGLTGFEPAFPLGYHKNYAGSALAMTLVIVLCAPEQVALPTAIRTPTILLLIAGAMATQSRGALLGAALGGLVWFFAPRPLKTNEAGVGGGNRLVAAALVLGFVAYAFVSVQAQLSADNVNTSSVGVRRDVERVTRELWRSSPVTGVGIRYFTSGEYGPFAQAPINAVSGELAESGVIGATGFVLFHGVVLALLYRLRRTALGLTAFALVGGRLLHGMFDIYWSSGLTPLPFLVAGMALAHSAQERTISDR